MLFADVFPSSEGVEEDVENLVMYLELRLGCSLENNASVIASDCLGLHGIASVSFGAPYFRFEMGSERP